MTRVKPTSSAAQDCKSYQGVVCNVPPVVVVDVQAPVEPTQTCCQRAMLELSKCVASLLNFKLELVAFLYYLFYNLTKVSSTTFILDRVCLVHFGYPDYVCANLKNYTALKPAIEIVANNYQLGHELLKIAPAAILGCFVGPWSDLYGRKLPVVLALSGMILDNLGSVICAYYTSARVEYFYIPAIFTGMCGGSVTMLAVLYSYASDTSTFSSRTLKYAYVEIASGLASPFGSAAGGWIFEFFGYPPVFFTAALGMIVTLLVWVVVLEETRGIGNTDGWAVKLKRLFSCESFKESFIATAKERPHKGQLQVILLVSSLCLVVITNNSTTGINYLFVHHQFDWSNAEYSTIVSLYSVFGMVLLVVIVPLYRRYGIGDAALGIVGTVSQLGKSLGVGFAYKPAIYHAARIFGLFMGCAPLAARSRISKVADADDIGKVFSFVATSESLLPILTTALMSQLFNVAINTFPGLPYIVLAAMLLFPLSVFIWLACLPSFDYETIQGKNSKSLEHESSVSI